MTLGRMAMKEIVKPIKDSWILKSVQKHLLEDFETGRRNYTIFQTGKATMLRVSDVLKLEKADVFDERGRVKRNAYTIDNKTGKRNVLYLKPVERDLEDYIIWLEEYQRENSSCNVYSSKWLFPSFTRPNKHIDGKRYYMIMHKVGETLNVNYLGTHTMRKTGAYLVYEQTGHNIALVMKLLNHSSEQMTLAYLGLDQDYRENTLDTINFG